jgi:DNA adenine methylase
MSALKAPFPWFGGKSRVADEVWQRFGDTPNYVEPFAGSLAVLLGRPGKHAAKIETVNDLDGFIANFWRGIAWDPRSVAHYADWPVNEIDLTARHAWLVSQRESLTRKLEGDPEFFDPKIAGWWVAGICGWIGSGYCSGEGPWVVSNGELTRRQPPDAAPGQRGQGRQPEGMDPDLSNAGQGVNRKMPHLGDAGQGVNRKMPHLGDAGKGIYEWFAQLSDRLRTVRVTSGDWTRVVSESVTIRHGLTSVFLDPPYGDETEQTRVYATDSGTVSDDVRDWCLENGNNKLLRIALCGYEGEGHDALLDYGWTAHAWRSAGGYGGGRGGTGEANRHKERIYFSPHCLGASQADLFGGVA